jgi:hypothetical protein
MKTQHVLASYAGPRGLLTVDLSLARTGIRLSVFDHQGRRHIGHLSPFQARNLGLALAELSQQAHARELAADAAGGAA